MLQWVTHRFLQHLEPETGLSVLFLFHWRTVWAAARHQMGKLFWWTLTSRCRLFEESKQPKNKNADFSTLLFDVVLLLLFRQWNPGPAGWRPPSLLGAFFFYVIGYFEAPSSLICRAVRQQGGYVTVSLFVAVVLCAGCVSICRTWWSGCHSD